ncbi:hypothetical protein SISNIDRAFT_801 [Sistotremastrum niveocremeum HHB9708]|uniref:Uncharacterized protein n=2 Tax=Sistotremastraceae TaxID=3402574 RepID=A0A165AC47_9AGAM|nr:hypothetical protein SISNIDRAFT_801 [Sistotremastrum niveocremeum HHB9708]KZT33703.1 hypothetical protein SISSUDRAFT_390287 [Sistotremastrum suecicum HHB10207 ss-3]
MVRISFGTWSRYLSIPNSNHFKPASAVILNNLCEPGDMGGKNPHNTSTVLCAVGTGKPNQVTLITQFVTSKLNGTPSEGLPHDACS